MLDTADLSTEYMLESMVTTAISNNTQKLTSITWELLVPETCKYDDLRLPKRLPTMVFPTRTGQTHQQRHAGNTVTIYM